MVPRRARLAVAGVPQHIIQRGNNRNACFFDDEDYELYLHLLADLSGRHGCRVHAFVLMTNHVHILLKPRAETGASTLMRDLGQDMSRG